MIIETWADAMVRAPQNPRGEDPRRLLRHYGPTSPLNLRESPPDHPISRPIPHVLMPVSP